MQRLTRLPVLFLVFLTVMIGVCETSHAVTSNEKIQTFTQPDGTKFQARLRGDEYYAYHETVDGLKIVQNGKTGYWEYAKLSKDGTLAESGAVVGKDVPNKSVFEADKAGYLKAVDAIADTKAAEIRRGEDEVNHVTPSGTVTGVILLVKFSDEANTFTQATFNDLFNTTNYNSNGALGCVKDYYKEVSYNNLTFNNTVYGWFTLPRTRAYYGANTGGPGTDVRAKDMIAAAIKEASATVNYSSFDADGDGWVDFFGVIHSGQGEEQSGASTDCIWSHQGSLAAAVTEDGIKIQRYHTDPEKLYTNLTTIGVICHESGHFFGLPDLYDTDGSSEGIGAWGLMGSGSWCGPGNNGAKPCHFCGWSKIVLGWLTPTDITASQNNFSLPALDQSATVARVFIDEYKDGEYFTIENRYKRSTGVAGTGFDQYLPGSGALIMHVDDYMSSNRNEARKKVDVEEADGLGQLDSKANRGNAGDVYTSGTFNDASTPNAKDNDANNTGITVTDFQGSGTATMTVDITPKSLTGYSLAYDLFGSERSFGTGWSDGDDYSAVLFTTASAAKLDRVKAFFPYNGTTNYTVNVYSGMNGSNQPIGSVLATASGSIVNEGYKEISFGSPYSFSAGNDILVELRYQYSGGTNSPIPLTDDYTNNDKSYINTNAAVFSYFKLTAAGGWPFDVPIRVDLAPAQTDTPTITPTVTRTSTPSSTPTSTPTRTPTSTSTDTPSRTPSSTPTNTPTSTPTGTATNTPTITFTSTVTNTPVDTATITSTGTVTDTPTITSTGTATSSPTTTGTASSTPTATSTNTPTPAPTNTPGGPILRYTFDGDAREIIGGWDGTTFGTPGFTTGRYGLAISLDGLDDYVGVPSTIGTYSRMTIAAWINMNDSSGFRTILACSGGEVGDFTFHVVEGILRFSLNGNVPSDAVSSSTIPINGWHHVVVVYDGVLQTVDFYVDGSPDGQAALTTALSPTLGPFHIGANDGIRYFDGDIDDLRIFDVALTPTEVGTLYYRNTASVLDWTDY